MGFVRNASGKYSLRTVFVFKPVTWFNVNVGDFIVWLTGVEKVNAGYGRY